MTPLEATLAAIVKAQRALDGTLPVTAAEVCEAAAFLGLFPDAGDRPDWPLLRDWVAGGV